MTLTLAEAYKALQIAPPASYTGDGNGSAVDVDQYDEDALVFLNVGATSGDNGAIADFVLEKSAVASGDSWSEAAAFDTIKPGTVDNQILAAKVNLTNVKRLRLARDFTGTMTVVAGCGVLVKSDLEKADLNTVTPEESA